MLLNPKGNSFYFVFPRGFFPPVVVDKYMPYIKKQPIPFDNINDYMNSTIQTIGFPGPHRFYQQREQSRPSSRHLRAVRFYFFRFADCIQAQDEQHLV